MAEGGKEIAAQDGGELVENRTHEAAPARRILSAHPESQSASKPPCTAGSPVSRKYSTRNSSAIWPTSCEAAPARTDEKADERVVSVRVTRERSASNSPRCRSRTRLAADAASAKLWVARKTVVFRRASARIELQKWAVAAASRLRVGSSSKSTR